MSQFFQDLWESIFTPGPTPSLVVATNVAFATLQTVLLVLLAATHSVHFVVLSTLCGGLWWAINWFVAELKASEAREATRAQREQSAGDSDTEVEVAAVGSRGAPPGSREVEAVEPRGELKHRPAAAAADTGGRVTPSQGSKSSVSTEDEWERVSENEREKDK